MKLVRIAAALAVIGAILTVAALAGPDSQAEPAHTVGLHDATSGEVQVAAIATEIVSSGPIASGVQGQALDNILVMEESLGTVSVIEDEDQPQLDADDELFDVVRIDDLPPDLRSHASTQGFSSPLYEGIDGNVDGVMLWSMNIAALLSIEGTARQERQVEVQELRIGPPPATRPVTTNVHVMVMRFPSEAAADHTFGRYGEQEGEVRVALRGVDEGSEFDIDEAIRDSERTYSERRREPIGVAGLGEHAYGESIAVAVLDYDRVANAYRSDRVVSWQYTETVTFPVGRYAAVVSRSAASPTDTLPADFDVRALAELISGRLHEIVP